MHKNLWRWLFLFLGMIVVGNLTACGSKQQESTKKVQTDQLQIVTTFYPMYEFTKQVAGKQGDVTMLIPAGTEPHDYEPSAKDVAKIVDSDVFVYNSKSMETWVERVLENVNTEHTLIVDASKGIELLQMDEHEDEDDHDTHQHDHGDVDPHIWLDPVRAQQQVTNIANELSKKAPKNGQKFAENAEAYKQQLAKLNTEYQTALTPAKNRVFVTQHTAFAYLAARYDLTQESISGLDPEQEPSPARLASLKQFISEKNIQVIYFESSASAKIADVLAQETGVELAELNPLEGLTEKQLAAGDNYLSVMRQNLKALQKSIY